MIFLKDELPNLHTDIKGTVHVHSDTVKIGHFKSKHKKNKILNDLKLQVKARATIQAEYKFNGNALIGVVYHVHKRGTKYTSSLSGQAIETNILENRNTLVDKYLSSLGLTGFYTAPVTTQLDDKVFQIFQRSYPSIYSRMLISSAKPSIEKHLSSIMVNGEPFHKAHLYVYHHPTIALAVAKDIYGLGVVGRLLHIYPGLHKIIITNRQLSYVINGKSIIYGKKFNEDPKAITSDYVNHIVDILTSHKLPTSTNVKRHNMFGLLSVTVQYVSENNYFVQIINTALRRILKGHPTVKNLTISNSTVVGNEHFRKVAQYPTIYHSTFRVSNHTASQRAFNKELINEVTKACLANKDGNYANVINAVSVIHSRYADWEVTIVELADKNATAVILLNRPNVKPKIVSHAGTSPQAMMANTQANIQPRNHNLYQPQKSTNMRQNTHLNVQQHAQKINQQPHQGFAQNTNNHVQSKPTVNQNVNAKSTKKPPHVTIYTPKPSKHGPW